VNIIRLLENKRIMREEGVRSERKGKVARLDHGGRIDLELTEGVGGRKAGGFR